MSASPGSPSPGADAWAAGFPDLTGKTVIVTGAGSGIGRTTAAAFASAGARVVLAVRDLAKGQAAASAMAGAARPVPVSAESLPESALTATGAPEVRELDLARLDSVRAFAAAWQGEIDLLINNAGVMVPPLSRTADIPPGGFAGPRGLGGTRGEPTLVARSAASRDPSAARRLWSASEELTGVGFPDL